MYTTIQNIQARTGNTLSAGESTYFTNVLSAAIDDYINRETGTTFGSVDALDVYVSGDDSAFLSIPTMYDITAVSHVDDNDVETGISVDEYKTYPRDETSKYAIRRLSGEWEEGFDNYKVTGKLGYQEVPDEIVMVATELASNGIGTINQSVKSEKVGDWSATYAEFDKTLSNDSRAILSSYRRLSRSM